MIDEASAEDKIKKVTWLSDRGLKVIDIDCGLKGVIIKTEDTDGTISYYSILEKHEGDQNPEEMTRALGGESLMGESSNPCIQQINVRQHPGNLQMHTFA